MANTLANNLSNPNAHLANAAAPGRNRASTTYRFRNPDKRRAYMASYMRTYRKRAPEKATAAA